MEKEEQRFIYTVNGYPQVGTLADYARLWREAQYTSDIAVSATVLTWDNTSDPVTWPVKVTRGVAEDDWIPYNLSVLGFGTVCVRIDGRA